MNEYLEANKEHWNEIVPIHVKAVDYYDAEGFKSHKMSLHSIELQELGDVSGKSLLHLQCHFGQDTLSWATLGAKVTGVDFSENAIDQARSLSRELGIEAEFIQSDIYQLPNILDEKYDIVFTSYGVLRLLPDLPRWAQVASHFVRPDGIFYIAEFHPYSWIVSRALDETGWQVRISYFDTGGPRRVESVGTYADRSANVTTHYYHWNHSLSNIVNELISSGLKIEYLHEHPESIHRAFPFLEEHSDGFWRPKEGHASFPLTFSIRAIKQA